MKDSTAIYTAFLRQHPPPYLFWRSPEGEVWITAGQQAPMQPPSSPAWRDWLHRHAADACSLHRGMPTFFIFGFDPAQPAAGIWNGFPSAALVCPSAAYHRIGDSEEFLGVDGEDFPHEEDAGSGGGAFTEQGRITIREWDEERYRSAVSEALSLLRSGTLQKIVLARSIRIVLSAPFDVRRALRSMQSQPHAFSLCYSPDGSRFFLSATPERLGSVRDGAFTTMALAGTLPRDTGTGSDPDMLLADAKERAEHAYVVEMIQEGIADYCSQLSVDDVRLLDLPHVTHILTRIQGVLSDGYGLNDMIAALHPTPAVAGTPREHACRQIAAIEQFPRGLYAGCVGWMNAAGNGDAAVAIRSAVVSGQEADAFAGAGIVRESDPAEEERETRAKLQTVLDILGA